MIVNTMNGVSTGKSMGLSRTASRVSVKATLLERSRAPESIRRIREFPGEDAPGTGQRNFPFAVEADYWVANPEHAMKTTEECYKEFAHLSRASCPIAVADNSPSGADVLNSPDSGPATGLRRRPLPFENPRVHPVDPISHLSKEARLRVLEIRRGC